jgi:hypothetical protein
MVKTILTDFNWSHPDVFSLSIPTVISVKTQLIYCQLKWRHVSTQGVVIRPIIEPCLRYIKWKCTIIEHVWSTSIESAQLLNHVWGTSSESAQLLNHVWGTSSKSAQLLNHVWGTSSESAQLLNQVWGISRESAQLLNECEGAQEGVNNYW